MWNGFGLVAGIPLDALTWLAAGVCLASLAGAYGAAFAIFMKAANAGFFAPRAVIRPDCHPFTFGSSLEKEPQHQVDARVLARDRERLLQVRACFA